MTALPVPKPLDHVATIEEVQRLYDNPVREFWHPDYVDVLMRELRMARTSLRRLGDKVRCRRILGMAMDSVRCRRRDGHPGSCDYGRAWTE